MNYTRLRRLGANAGWSLERYRRLSMTTRVVPVRKAIWRGMQDGPLRLWRVLAGVESHGNLLQPLTQRVAETREDLGRSFAQLFFGRRRDLGNHVSRLVIECRHGCHHP